MVNSYDQWRRQIIVSKHDTNNHWYDDTDFPLSISTSFVLQANLLNMNANSSWASTLTWLPTMNRVDVTYDELHTGNNFNLSISMIGKA